MFEACTRNQTFKPLVATVACKQALRARGVHLHCRGRHGLKAAGIGQRNVSILGSSPLP
jgi:hypothetical protein